MVGADGGPRGSNWLFLSKNKTKTVKEDFYQGREDGKHLILLTLHLNREQRKLLNDSIVISKTDKNQYYILEMWELKRFTEPVLTKWTAKSPARKFGQSQSSTLRKIYIYQRSRSTKRSVATDRSQMHLLVPALN